MVLVVVLVAFTHLTLTHIIKPVSNRVNKSQGVRQDFSKALEIKKKKKAWEEEMKKGGKKIINNKSKKILPVLISIVHEIVHKWEFS